MATTVSSHTATQPLVSSTSKPNLANLHNHLDNLWISYLNYLDNYTSAQNLIQQHMRAGFLSLARANFNSRGGVRRYGKDYFHERAVASTRARISKLEGGERFRVDVGRWDRSPQESERDESMVCDDENVKVVEKQQQQQPSPPATPAPESSAPTTTPITTPLNNLQPESKDDSMDDLSNKSNGTKPETKTKTNLDPLRWFGLLVPPELRKAQNSFVLALEEAVADAVNATKRMRELEVGIRRVRKEIRKAERAAGG